MNLRKFIVHIKTNVNPKLQVKMFLVNEIMQLSKKFQMISQERLIVVKFIFCFNLVKCGELNEL